MVEARGIEAATGFTHPEAADAGRRSAQFLGIEADRPGRADPVRVRRTPNLCRASSSGG